MPENKSKAKCSKQRGLTVIELMIAIVIAAIVISGISAILVDSQRGWNVMYSRIYSDVATDSHVAKKMFDALIRKASCEKFSVGDAGDWIEVNYYADSTSSYLDSYARLYKTDNKLNVEYGSLNPKKTLSVQTVCSNVTSCVFKTSGQSAQMMLKLNNGTKSATVISAAVMHSR